MREQREESSNRRCPKIQIIHVTIIKQGNWSQVQQDLYSDTHSPVQLPWSQLSLDNSSMVSCDQWPRVNKLHKTCNCTAQIVDLSDVCRHEIKQPFLDEKQSTQRQPEEE